MSFWGWFFLSVAIFLLLSTLAFLYLIVKGGEAEGFFPQEFEDDDK